MLRRFYLSDLLIATLVTSIYVGFNFIPRRVNRGGQEYGWPGEICCKYTSDTPYEFYTLGILFNIVIGLGLFAFTLCYIQHNRAARAAKIT